MQQANEKEKKLCARKAVGGLTSARVATFQPEGLFAIAQAVDKGAKLTHVLHTARHHHLFLNHVGLWQVHPPLHNTYTAINHYRKGRTARTVFCFTHTTLTEVHRF